MKRWIVGLLVTALATLLALPGQALAHAELLSTDPAAGTVLDTAPEHITLSFSEPVEISLGAIRLFDGDGASVEVGAASHPGGADTAVRVEIGSIPNGSYVVDWRVVSADSHPVQGAFTFQVGPTSDLQPGILTDILGREHSSRPAGIGLAITRGLIIAAIALVFGGTIVLGWGVVEVTGTIRRVILGGAVVGAVAGLLQLPLEVGYATGRSLSVLSESSAWSAALDTRIGTAWAVRAAILAVFGIGLVLTIAERTTPWWRALSVAGLVAVGVVSAYGGHGATGRWVLVGILATAVHVSAMAVWLGGLVVLIVGFRRLTVVGAQRYSALALAMIATVVASGVIQSIRQLGSFDALTNTSYGTALIWKLTFVVVLLMVASVSRRVVRRGVIGQGDAAERDDADGAAARPSGLDRPRLGKSIAIEGILAIAILTSTSLLMAANPAQVIASKPFSITLLDNDYLASITIEPGRTGPNELHLYLSSAASSLIEPDEVHIEISDPSRDVAALEIPVTRSGAGHYTTPAATFPYAATWTLLVTARYNQFDEVQFTTEVPIR